MTNAFLETTMHPNGKSQMANAILEITMLETIMYSNGKCTLGNNSARNNSNGKCILGNNKVCLNMTCI
jgi:hypothetical protein